MTGFQNLISELREKRLWPVAVALLVALVAVPVLLSSSPGPVAVGSPRAVAGPSGSVPALPAVSVTATPSKGPLTGPARNPFLQQVKSTSAGGSGATTSSTSASAGKGSSGSTGSQGPTKSAGASGGTTTTSTTAPTTTTTTPATTPKPTVPGLTATQSYHVTFAVTTVGGGLNTVDPVERLSVLPSSRVALLVELGVLKGGGRVLFAVEPWTQVAGPGKCIPGPIDCQIVSLAPSQTETVSLRARTGIVPVAQFAVTAIKTDGHASAAAARKARERESAAGRRLLDRFKLGALSLFPYKADLGAIVDQRNLTAGGN